MLDEPSEIVFRFRFGSDASIQNERLGDRSGCFQPVATCTIGLDEPNFDDIVSGPIESCDHERKPRLPSRHRTVFGALTDVRGRFCRFPQGKPLIGSIFR